jgi:saxitoxin biosynthesis operon SxtJ-like protein
MGETADRRRLRSFGFLLGGLFAFVGLWPAAFAGRPMRVWALGAAVLLALPAALHPPLLARPYRAWMAVGHALGWINTRVILTLFFCLVLTPVGLVMRLVGRDPMRRAYDPKAASYRQPRDPRAADHMRHQF